jgi:hypothetical protein
LKGIPNAHVSQDQSGGGRILGYDGGGVHGAAVIFPQCGCGGVAGGAGARCAWGDGGRIRSYAIERRQQQENGKKGAWTHVAVSLKNRAELPDEPKGVLLEYRVVALKTSGTSEASNVASVVL